MKKSIIISEQDNIAALLENDRVVEFFVNRGELLLGDIYTTIVENILPGIDAAFVNLGKDKMGFLHANDVPGQGPLKERLVPKQKLLVQITKEPTGHKGPRVSTAISMPGRFLVLVPEERGVSISRRISDARERARLKSVVNLLKPPGVGLIIRTEAKGQGEQELFEDFELLWDRWQSIVSDAEASIGPTLIYRDQDLLYRVIRDAYSSDVSEVICDTVEGHQHAQQYLSGWASKHTQVLLHSADESLLVLKGVDREIEAALSDRVELPSGGHLNIEPTEALTVIDVNSGRFTSSRTQAETVRRTNLEASQEIPRQLRLRNIGGMVIVDFIDMDSRKDQQQVLEVFQRHLEEDRAKPQIGQLSDLGLVELTRRRQGQSLRELFAVSCPTCSGLGAVPTLEIGKGEHRKVIEVRTRDDDARRRGAVRGRQSGQVLRAATASIGRIQPSVVEEAVTEIIEDLAVVPDDILEQVPDDLFSGHGGERSFSKSTLDSTLDSADEQENSAEDEDLGEIFAEGRSTSGKPMFEEFDDESEDSGRSSKFEDTLARAEQLRVELQKEATELEMDGEGESSSDGRVNEGTNLHIPLERSPYEAAPDRYSEQAGYVQVPEQHLVHSHKESEHVQNEKAHEPASNASFVESESSFKVEPESITGVFRLKAKNQEVSESSDNEAGNMGIEQLGIFATSGTKQSEGESGESDNS